MALPVKFSVDFSFDFSVDVFIAIRFNASGSLG